MPVGRPNLIISSNVLNRETFWKIQKFFAFSKCKLFNENSRNSRRKIKWNKNFKRKENLKNFGVPRKFALFCGNSGNCCSIRNRKFLEIKTGIFLSSTWKVPTSIQEGFWIDLWLTLLFCVASFSVRLWRWILQRVVMMRLSHPVWWMMSSLLYRRLSGQHITCVHISPVGLWQLGKNDSSLLNFEFKQVFL